MRRQKEERGGGGGEALETQTALHALPASLAPRFHRGDLLHPRVHKQEVRGVPTFIIERKWGALRVLAPRSMGANKFGTAFMQNSSLMVTDKRPAAAAAERMRQENEGQSPSHKRGVCGSIHLSRRCRTTGSAPMHLA